MSNPGYTILFISSGQPSVNPRLVKEADTLAEAGYNVKVIYSYWTHWASERDKKLLQNKRWQGILAGGNPVDQKLIYYFTRLRFKILSLLYKKTGINPWLAEFAKTRAYFELLQKTKKQKADLYIAHNLAALPIAVKAAKKYKAKCGFDAEDFHRQEVTDNKSSPEFQICKYLEDKYLPKVNYMSAASPLIAENYREIYPEIQPIVINNVFSSKLQPELRDLEKHTGLKLFWFSQTIGKGRGLEDIIIAMGLLKNSDIAFTLLGAVNDETKAYFIKIALDNSLEKHQLQFLNPVSPDEIFSIGSQHDIGLALEQNTPLNRDICLTNKIFTYIISGIAVIASETKAQKEFMNSYPAIGKSYPIGDIAALSELIQYYYSHKKELKNAKMAACELGKNEFNWEVESRRFLNIIKSVI